MLHSRDTQSSSRYTVDVMFLAYPGGLKTAKQIKIQKVGYAFQSKAIPNTGHAVTSWFLIEWTKATCFLRHFASVFIVSCNNLFTFSHF